MFTEGYSFTAIAVSFTIVDNGGKKTNVRIGAVPPVATGQQWIAGRGVVSSPVLKHIHGQDPLHPRLEVRLLRPM